MDSHGRSVVQSHLLEEKGADEEHGADHVSTVFEAVDGPQCEAEHDRVVP